MKKRVNVPEEATFGSWTSPITADLLVQQSIGLGDIITTPQRSYWLEMRPNEGGRYVLMSVDSLNHITELTPEPYNVRSRVHEYGGGAFTTSSESIYFTNFKDQRIYKIENNGRDISPISSENNATRYADLKLQENLNWLVAVKETHDLSSEPKNTIVIIDCNRTYSESTLVSRADFFSSPIISPDGTKLAWVQWNHPNMPWDSTELWTATINQNKELTNTTKIAGNSGESVCQPLWSPTNDLFYVSDISGWWNLYQYENKTHTNLTPFSGEVSQAQWGFGSYYYGFKSEDSIIYAINIKGEWSLHELNLKSRNTKKINTQFNEVNRSGIKVCENNMMLGAGSGNTPFSIYLGNDNSNFKIIRNSQSAQLEKDFISLPENIEFPTENGLNAYGFYYCPKNPNYVGKKGTTPPLIVLSHGGPTGATSTSLDLSIQFWTTRGFAVFDVNYGGSTGYGTEYRKRLNNKWGIVDVQDCVNGAKYLVEKNKADPDRLAIRGSSAGGYTTLACLTFTTVFKAGASYYGISDLSALAEETHKFESRYLDSMIGSYKSNKIEYTNRSPINHTEKLSCPVIMFQGLEDKIVLPNQSKMMADALHKNGIPFAHLEFEGEQHGFRKAENIKKSIESELYFYSKVFGFSIPDEINHIKIINLPS